MSLPPGRPGQVITAGAWNALVDHVNRTTVTSVSGGLELRRGAAGTVLSAPDPAGLVADFLTTSVVTKRVGTQLGHGTATRQVVGADGKYVSAARAETVWSKWADKTINSGAYVTCLKVGAVWEIVDVDDCAHTS